MKVSVVICTYSEEMYEHFEDSLESVQSQTYDDVEIVVIVDGNEALYERILSEYGDDPQLKIHCNDENVGLSGSRNNALEYVTGDIVALIDDDAVADERWVEELVSVYEERDAIAVGGKMTPLWVAGKPEFLPEEFYWLVGVTHRGFAEPGEEVRNTFGSNISFKTEVLRELGGFATEVGRQGEKNLQAHETEFCARMREEYGRGVIYNPDAKVGHKVFEWRTDKRWLLERSFWQGYSKRAMETLVSEESSEEESDFLKKLLFAFVPSRVKSLVADPDTTEAKQLFTLFVLTGTVGIGYLYGLAKW
ncbi:glucosyl-dolichyl phosphate glucuronosyltransferase [Halobellus limi]|uniref:Glycosyl transferase family 2 n=1 Tax=Halobellus limi TaxID=699433 RepID=A0A1H5USR2_9EURY|nr:glucosyl-dolichyl phosphate glucuronosyltransferase [Halobellus limi]QCC46961.1 glycosyltransferase family 2 protein [Halobellus limi]SEF77237.1 Glycosyl transferase family 2 [Halobellus limi]